MEENNINIFKIRIIRVYVPFHYFLNEVSVSLNAGRCWTSDGIFLNQSMKNVLFKLPVYFKTAIKPTMRPPTAIHFSFGDLSGIGDTNFCCKYPFLENTLRIYIFKLPHDSWVFICARDIYTFLISFSTEVVLFIPDNNICESISKSIRLQNYTSTMGMTMLI